MKIWLSVVLGLSIFAESSVYSTEIFSFLFREEDSHAVASTLMRFASDNDRNYKHYIFLLDERLSGSEKGIRLVQELDVVTSTVDRRFLRFSPGFEGTDSQLGKAAYSSGEFIRGYDLMDSVHPLRDYVRAWFQDKDVAVVMVIYWPRVQGPMKRLPRGSS